MTKEEVLAALRNLQNHATSNTREQQQEIDNETAEIDISIEEYNEKIAELEAKLADMDNYQYEEFNREERELTEELLEESFANQLEVLDREDNEYKHLQDLATSIFTDYNEEIAQLNVDIASIERRLRKNDIAIRKNIGIKLTDAELADLNSALESKRARIAACEKYKIQYTEELSNYGELITANNRKRELVIKKQEKLAAIKAERANNPKTIDNYKLRKDKDELASLKAGLLALQSRKDYINFDMKSEVEKLISETEKLDFGMESIEEEKIEAPINNEIDDENEFIDTEFHVNEHKFDDEPEETNDKVLPLLDPESDLDEEREAEIEEAKEALKQKKKDGFFKRHWKKFVAAGLAAVAILYMKGCHDIKNADRKDLEEASNSYAQSDEGITTTAQDDFDSKYEVPDTAQVDVNNSIEASNSTVTPSEQKITQSATATPTPSVTPVEEKKDPAPAPVQNEETKTVHLNPGDKMVSVADVFNDKVSDDTVIAHGEAVGTSTGSATITDYTEDGKAVVEYETGKESETKKMTKEEYKSLLDKLSGGTGVLTPEGEQWLDELASGKTR